MVFTEGSMKAALTDAKEAIKCITGVTKHYETCYFEAFPDVPKTFIRGEGKTMQEAETDAWNQFVKFSACIAHVFTDHLPDQQPYTNGAGFCSKCGLFVSNLFQRPIDIDSDLEIRVNKIGRKLVDAIMEGTITMDEYHRRYKHLYSSLAVIKPLRLTKGYAHYELSNL